MKQYRITVFKNNTHEDTYFDGRDEAILFGAKQLSKQSVISVYLLSHSINGGYEIEMEIKEIP